MSSTLTLDCDIERLPRPAAVLTDAGDVRRAAPASPPRRTTRADSLLWSFDESAERMRFASIQARLMRLEAALFEEWGTRINAGSRDCLLRLFVAYPANRAPIITCSPDGVLTATWRRDSGEELAIRCVDSNLIHFAIATRSEAEPHRLDRQWGTSHSPALFFAGTEKARAIAR